MQRGKLFFKYLFICLLIGITSFSIFVQKAAAETVPNSVLPTQSNGTVDINTTVQVVTLNLLSSIECQLGGTNSLRQDHKCLTADPKTGQLTYTSNTPSLISNLISVISKTTVPPVHTIDSINYARANFGVSHAYAASGVDTIQPLVGIWSAFRNIVYILYVLALVLVGFAIMLRLKIDPRTVMTIQNQLPKIIINLLLVTFSFAIAGLLIDAMWLLVYVFINIITSIPGTGLTNNAALPTQYILSSPIGFVDNVLGGGYHLLWNNTSTGGGLSNFAGQAGDALQSILTKVTASFGSSGDCVFWFGVNVGACMSQIVGWIVGSLLGKIIVYIAILIALIRLWWALIQAYMYILLNIVLAPFMIFGGIIPGVKSGFGAWLKTMISNLAVFPAALAFLLLSQAIIDSLLKASGTLFTPPLIIDSWTAGGTGSMNSFGILLGLVVLLLTPKVTNMVKDAIGAADFKYASGVFEAVGSGQQAASSLYKGAIGQPFFSQQNLASGYKGGHLTQRLMQNEWMANIFRVTPYKK